MTPRLTPEELDAIRRRTEAATPGPWEWDRDKSQWKNWIYPNRLYGDGMVTDVICADDYHMELRECDHAFIQHARTDIPRLLAEVDALTRERDAARN